MTPPLRLALVGHTNTGKTSLTRTLTRNASFGQVSNSPGTTRKVDVARLTVDGETVIEWYDTPGMEDSVALLDYVDDLCAGTRLDGPDRIRRFLDSPEAHGRFDQEARVLDKALDCDAALYVIDARDPVLAKHRDELSLLAACGKPLLPVLNFTRSAAQHAQPWRDAMARLGLHVQAEFDSVLPALDGERQLYQRLTLLLDRHGVRLRALTEHLEQARRQRRDDAFNLLAQLLVDAAALHIACAPDDAAVARTASHLHEQIRAREQQFVDAVLERYRFGRDDLASDRLPLDGHRWGMDLFHPQALKDMGVQVGTGIAAGAVAGAAVDVMTAGLSLGTGTLVGAAAGGVWQGVERVGKRLMGRVRGQREISVDDSVLRLLALRGQTLIQALEQRGHAATQPFALAAPKTLDWQTKPLPAELKEARSRAEWSALSAGFDDDDRRRHVVQTLSEQLSRTATKD